MPPRALGLALGLVLAGCGHPSPPPSPSVAPRHTLACVILPDSAGPTRPITAAFDDPADARTSRLAASRLAPVRRDCEGRVTAGLASRWSADTSGRFWTLDLAGAAPPAFADRPRWTAAALAATWRADPEASLVLRDAGVVSMLPLDDARLVVGLAAPARELPAVFAARALGVTTGAPDAVIDRSPASGDLRDAIDAGVDLVLSGDPDLLEYATRRPGLTRESLPWRRLYVLLVPAGRAGDGPALPTDTAGFRVTLAQNVVRTDARPAGPPTWADSAARCAAASAGGGSTSKAIIYPAGDPTARGLAERLVALGGAAAPVVRALEPDSFAAALRRGDARGFIVSGPLVAPSPCLESAGWPAGARVIPLVETRAHAVVRRGTPALAVELDGAVRLAEPADTAGAVP
jgi:hypothetical protein